MMGWDDALAFGLKIIDKVIPDPVAREQAKVALLKQEQAGELDEMKTSLSAILAEAGSSDKWTSRARPAFLYVIYIYILAAIPVGILSIFDPGSAKALADGVKAWLLAIPDQLYWLFGAGYLGYTGGRTFEKWRGGK
jgi:hypothetical protein